MKKNVAIISFLLIISCFFMFACEKSTQIRSASFSEITSAGSKNYGVKVTYSEDKRLKEKGTDIQIKFNKTGTIKIWQEGKEKFDYVIEDFDEWQSMTHILNQAYGKGEGDKFEKYQDVLSKSYLFNFDGNIKITFRAIVGEIEKNSDESGEILVGGQTISDNFTLNVK